MTIGDVIAIAALVVTLLTAAFVFIPALRKSRTDATVAEVDIDDKIAERRLGELNRLYARVGVLEASDEDKAKKLSALGRIVTALAEQWPATAPAPVFEDADLAELADTLPAKWRRTLRPRRA